MGCSAQSTHVLCFLFCMSYFLKVVYDLCMYFTLLKDLATRHEHVPCIEMLLDHKIILRNEHLALVYLQWMTLSCSYHRLQTPLDLAVEQTNDEAHPRRLEPGRLRFCCCITGGSFWFPQCCQNPQYVQFAQLAWSDSCDPVLSTGKLIIFFNIQTESKNKTPPSLRGAQSQWIRVLISAVSDKCIFLSFNEQLVLGVGMYLIPVTPVTWRAAFMPLHVYSGLLLFTSVIAVALMGITEKLIFAL